MLYQSKTLGIRFPVDPRWISILYSNSEKRLKEFTVNQPSVSGFLMINTAFKRELSAIISFYCVISRLPRYSRVLILTLCLSILLADYRLGVLTFYEDVLLECYFEFRF